MPIHKERQAGSACARGWLERLPPPVQFQGKRDGRCGPDVNIGREALVCVVIRAHPLAAALDILLSILQNTCFHPRSTH
jgi:hypothetical protein